MIPITYFEAGGSRQQEGNTSIKLPLNASPSQAPPVNVGHRTDNVITGRYASRLRP
jgi:hypothetical protein